MKAWKTFIKLFLDDPTLAWGILITLVLALVLKAFLHLSSLLVGFLMILGLLIALNQSLKS